MALRKRGSLKRSAGSPPNDGLTAEQIAEATYELRSCHPNNNLDGCVRFFERHLRITDKDSGVVRPFTLWKPQVDLLRLLCDGCWLIILKARQLGITWVVAGYILWRMTFCRFYTSLVVQQNLFYAKQFMSEKMKFMRNHLPRYMQTELITDTTQELKFGSNTAFSLDSSLTVLPATEDAGRSFTGNFLCADEAVYMPSLKETYRAARPALLNANGQAAIISTSGGPAGDFYEMFSQTLEYTNSEAEVRVFDGTQIYRPPASSSRFAKSRLTGVFFPWNAHPGRDRDWYENEAQENRADPCYMPREFPETPEEAFTAAGGRIYAAFSKKPYPEGHLHRFASKDINKLWTRYRGIDWGETASAFVCLWAVEIPSDRPGFTIDPSCVELIKELLSYCYDPEKPDKAVDEHDHGPDALRYLVTTFDVRRWLHVYREWYVYNAVAQGHTTQTLCAGIRARSGWECTLNGAPLDLHADPLAIRRVREGDRLIWRPTDWVEDIECTAYDRARAMLGNELADFDIAASPHTCPGNEKLDKEEELREGRVCVNRLIVGALPNRSDHEKTAEDLERERLTMPDPLKAMGVRTGEGLLDRIRKHREREKIVRRKLGLLRRRGPYHGPPST